MFVTLLSAAAALLALAAPAAQAAVSIASTSVSATDGTVTATFTVTRTGGILTGPTTVRFSTADASAHAPGDYDAVTGELQFGSLALGGTQVQTIPVGVAGDRLDEADETIRLVLSGSGELVAGKSEAVGTISDDDPPPVVGVLDAPAAAEGATATFTIALSAPSGRDVSVAFATADAGAIADQDYAARSGMVGIAAGATSVTLGVVLLDDGADEPDESFELQIGFPVFATTGRATAGATIVDNDEAPGPGASGSTTAPSSRPCAGSAASDSATSPCSPARHAR